MSARRREGELSADEQPELPALAQLYQRLWLRQSEVLAEVVRRGLLPRVGAVAPDAPPADPANAPIAGILTVVWGDALDGTSTIAYFLTTPDGRRRQLLLDPAAAGGLWPLNGERVTVWTAAEGPLDGPAAERLRAHRVAPADRAAGSEPLAGNLPYLSILCAFPDGDGEFKALPFYADMYGDEFPESGHYWDEVSYGAVSLDGSGVAGPFAVPHPAGFYGIDDFNEDLDRLADDCVAAADLSVDFAAYDGINLMTSGSTRPRAGRRPSRFASRPTNRRGRRPKAPPLRFPSGRQALSGSCLSR